jgi:hypothetical protein
MQLPVLTTELIALPFLKLATEDFRTMEACSENQLMSDKSYTWFSVRRVN